MTPAKTIVFHDVAPTTHTEQIIEPAALLAQSAELRDQIGDTSTEATDLHRNVEQLNLNQLTRKLEAESPISLLNILADDFLFPWALLARVVGVSPTAVRKWRRGEAITPIHHQRLAEFVAFCQTLQDREPRITNVPHWLEMPVDRRVDASRLDLFLEGMRTGLLELVAGRRTCEELLDEAAPGWHELAVRGRQFEVITHEDGSTSIVPREAERRED